MSECPKPQCIQDARIATLEVLQGRDRADVRELKKRVKEIHASVVGNGGRMGLKARVDRNSIYLKLIGAAIVLIPSAIIAYVALTR